MASQKVKDKRLDQRFLYKIYQSISSGGGHPLNSYMLPLQNLIHIKRTPYILHLKQVQLKQKLHHKM